MGCILYKHWILIWCVGGEGIQNYESYLWILRYLFGDLQCISSMVFS